MQPIEIDQLVNGEPKSTAMPPMRHGVGSETPTLVPGPDVIVGDLPSMGQFGNDTVNHLVGLGVGTTSCNNGDQPFHWSQLPNTDHPVIPQNLYRMSGGATNDERFEQIGQSWMKHAFTALEGTVCGTCNTSGCTQGTNLCPGCSDPYGASLNATQTGIGSRAWVNPFTGVFPSTANSHSGHSHAGTSHRVTVAISDLNPAQNSGATYFAEGQYLTPHEYAWCQSHPGQCNMYNNASYRRFNVSGSGDNYTFSSSGSAVRIQAAINAWQTLGGATVNQIEPDPGNDGIWFMGYKVTNASTGVWHYEYALYNQNLDRAIQSFSVPLGLGVNISNIGFHAPRQEPGWANDGTLNNQGYSSMPWNVTQGASSITWTRETFAQNQNANAIRFGTLYNFRFDSDQAPQNANVTVGFFKTGSPMMVAVQAPMGVGTPTPTPTASPSPTATATATLHLRPPLPSPQLPPRPLQLLQLPRLFLRQHPQLRRLPQPLLQLLRLPPLRLPQLLQLRRLPQQPLRRPRQQLRSRHPRPGPHLHHDPARHRVLVLLFRRVHKTHFRDCDPLRSTGAVLKLLKRPVAHFRAPTKLFKKSSLLLVPQREKTRSLTVSRFTRKESAYVEDNQYWFRSAPTAISGE